MGLFDDPPAARSTDPITSHYAKRFRLNEDRIMVLGVHARHPYGLTDYELAAFMGRQFNSVNVRRGELRNYGYIEQTSMKRPAPSGSSCIVWRITESGIEFAKEWEERFG